VCIEGISFGSVGSAALIDLSGLNYMVRLMAMENNIKHIYIVSPTQNKKFATGNGSAEKDVMISAWLKLQKHMSEVQSYVKTDDIADAYFLARYGASLLSA
jgi:Holliday junction resolvasome RuvABC endonuclease subunit